MFLAVDIGNSQTCFGIFDDGEGTELKTSWRFETKPSRTSDEYGSLLFPLLARAGLSDKWSAIALASVVPTADFSFETFCKNYWHQIPFKIHPGMSCEVKLNVDVPSEVGADRIANAAYALHHMKLPAIIVDYGTATTIDVVSKERAFVGGAILPGVRLGVESLGAKTSKLPRVDLEFPKNVIGRNTVDCIRSGALYGYCDLIDGLLTRTVSELGEKADIVLTGGLSSLFHGRLSHSTRLVPEVTLEGIRLLHDHRKNTH